MLYLFVIAIVSLSYLWLRRRYSYWERRGVPGPKPVYIFGNLIKQMTFQEHISLAYQRWHNTYNNVPYIGFYKLLQPAVMIRDPELQQEVLVKAFMNFQTNDVTISDMDELLKSNPFFVKGEEWRQGRALFATFLSANKIKAVFPTMLNVGNEWEQYVRSLGINAEVDAKDICSRCTFSIDGKSFEGHSEFLDMGKSVFNPDLVTTMKSMLVFSVPILQKLIQELTETQITGTCTVLFIEAYETSANTLSLALYNLQNSQHIQDELARCIEESLESNDNAITYDLVYKLEFLEKVALECMRIQATFFGVQKLCTKAYTMPRLPGQSKPVTIPAGTPVLVPFATVQLDPAHFSDPDFFDPERFSPERKALRSKSAYMPFSDGPRMCSGLHLAMFNFKMGLFQIIRRFDVKLHPNNKPFKLHPMSFFNIPKDRFKLTFTPRHPSV